MRKTALITGATSGIGLELSKVFARNGYDLVLVARDEDGLTKVARELETESCISIKTIARDLSNPSSAQEVFHHTLSLGIQIDVLVNNAGAGLNGYFVENRLEDEIAIIQLNIASLAAFCHLFGKEMVKRGSGRILNVASTAAFQPGPLMSNYYASKAYVFMLSEGLRNELKRDGVVLTTLCPGPTQTGFFERANMKNTVIAHVPYLMRPEKVAEIGYAALMNGEKVVIAGMFNRLLAFSTRLSPRGMLISIARFLNQRRSSWGWLDA